MLVPDLSLIRGYTPEDDLDPRPAVVTLFERAPKQLYYINAEHVVGIDNDTCRAIDLAMDGCDPHAVIVEGIPTAWGPSDADYLEHVERYAADGFIRGGECSYVTWRAHKRGIPFIGGEPTDSDVFRAVAQLGYSHEETGCLYTLRMIPQDRREGLALTEDEHTALANERFTRGFAKSPDGQHLTIEQFRTWYDAHQRDGRSFADIANDELAPFETPAASYFQKLSAAIGRVREEHLVSVIADTLNKYDRVLVVYGDGHLVKSRAVFEKMLGVGKIVTA